MWLQIITRLLVDIEEDEVHVLIVYINKVYLKKRPANEQSCCYSALYGTILGCMLKIFVEREGGGCFLRTGLQGLHTASLSDSDCQGMVYSFSRHVSVNVL